MKPQHRNLQLLGQIFLVWVFILTQTAGDLARAGNPAPNAEGYLSAFRSLPINADTESLLRQDTQEAQKLLAANPKLAATSSGRELKFATEKYGNYFKVKESLSNCDYKDDKNTIQSIIAVAQGLNPSRCGCRVSFANNYSKVTEAVRFSELQDQITKNALKNSLQSYYKLEASYGSGKTSGLVEKLCQGKCTPSELATLKAEYARLQTGPQPKRADLNHEYSLLVNGLASANKPLSKIYVQAEHKLGNVTKVFDSPLEGITASSPAVKEKDKALYSQYQNLYGETIKTPAGFLLATKTMQDEFGAYKDLGQDLKADHLLQYTIEPHKTQRYQPEAERAVMERAINEARSAIEKETQSLLTQQAAKEKEEGTGSNKSYRSPDKSKADLEDLVSTDVVSVAQALIDNPNAAGDVCGLLKSAQAHQQRNKIIKKWAFRSFFVLAGIATAGFLGTAAAGAAGVVSASTVSTVGAYATVAATAGSALGSSESYVDAYQAYQNAERLEGATLSGRTDAQGIIRAQQARQQFYAATNTAAKSTLLTAVDVATVTKGLQAAKEARSVEEVTQSIKAANEMNQTGELSSSLSEMRRANDIGPEKTGHFLKALFTRVSDKTQKLVLGRLKNASPEKLKEFSEIAEQEGKLCK